MSEEQKPTTKATTKLVKKLPLKRQTAFWDPVQTVILTIATYLTSQLVASILVLTIPLLFGVTEASLKVWLRGAVGQFLLIVLIEAFVMLILWGLLHVKKSSFTDIGLAWPRLKDVGLAIVGFFVYLVLYVVIALVARLIFPTLDFQQEQRLGFETAAAGGQLVLVFISLVILPPLVEEVLARGFLYTGLKTKLPIWAAAVITSVMFAVAHLQFGSGAPLLWVAAIDTFTLSLVLVYLRERTGNLGASIALHMLKNGLAFTLLFIFNVR